MRWWVVVLFVCTAWSACGEKPRAIPDALPGVHIAEDRSYIDLDAKVIGNGLEWLELLACSPGSREHESVLTVEARPSHIHLALLLIGAAPGNPQRAVMGEDGQVQTLPAWGDALQLFLIDPAYPEVEIPAHELVTDRRTGQMLSDNRWLFTGSRVHEDEQGRAYVADFNGTVVSLVHFGDDLIAHPTNLTQSTDAQALATNPEKLPPQGSAVVLRIRRK
jgi:hypothetical protein